MSNSKRKLFKTMVSLALVAVIGVGTVFAALAALNATVTSGFSISYVAQNVHARVIGEYVQGGDAKAKFGDDIVFEGPEDNGISKEFPNKDFTLAGPNDVVEVYYTIINTSDEFGFGVTMDVAGLNLNNFDVKYSFSYWAGPSDEDANAGNHTNGAPEADFSMDTKPDGIYLKPKGSDKSAAVIAMQFKVNQVVQKADVNGSIKFNLDGTADAPTDLYDSLTKSFDAENINSVLQKITGDPTFSISSTSSTGARISAANMSKLDEMASAENDYNIAGSDAQDFRANNNGEDLIVTLGGLTWHVCYLSKDKNGNDILTLWLTSSQQDAWKDRKANEGQYYGFLDGSLYSDWAANWAVDNTTYSYPSSMYGTSYIRTVTLNNGGSYSTSGGESLLTYTKNKESLFALFTIEELGLANYIVKPKDVEWQEYGQSTRDISSFDYNLPNENWSSDLAKVPDTGFYDSEHNYAHKGVYNSAWKDDYLWLPSMSETGYKSGTHGLWQLDVAQRKNGSLSSSYSVGKVGQTSGAAFNYSWLRSGNYASARSSWYLRPSGSGYNPYYVDTSYAVRPALHLNLTKIANELANA